MILLRQMLVGLLLLTVLYRTGQLLMMLLLQLLMGLLRIMLLHVLHMMLLCVLMMVVLCSWRGVLLSKLHLDHLLLLLRWITRLHIHVVGMSLLLLLLVVVLRRLVLR